VSVLCNPPQPGDPSYELWAQERADEFASLSRRAALVSDAFNSLPNMSVVPTQAAMYSFPEVHLPHGAIAAAEAAGKKPDVFYCLQ
jgi:aspartate/methionine/tyrosine aminotransferase